LIYLLLLNAYTTCRGTVLNIRLVAIFKVLAVTDAQHIARIVFSFSAIV